MSASKLSSIILTSLKEEFDKVKKVRDTNTQSTGSFNISNNYDVLAEEYNGETEKVKLIQNNFANRNLDNILVPHTSDFNLEVNTFSEENAIHASPLSSSLSSSSKSSTCSSTSSSLLTTLSSRQKISTLDFEAIFSINEALFEIELKKLDASLDKLGWSLKSILDSTCVNTGGLSQIRADGQQTLFFSETYLECNVCKFNVNLNKVVSKLKILFENTDEYDHLNILINKSTMSVINLIINYKHECSNNSNFFIIKIVIKKFLKSLKIHLNKKKISKVNNNLVLGNHNSNVNDICENKGLIHLDQLDNNNQKVIYLDNSFTVLILLVWLKLLLQIPKIKFD